MAVVWSLARYAVIYFQVLVTQLFFVIFAQFLAGKR